MLTTPRPILALACALALAGTSLPAQADKPSQPEQIAKIIQLLDRIEKALQAAITPERIEERLRARTPTYRTISKAGGGAAAPAAGDAPGAGTADAAKPKARLFGDTEKADLPAGTVLLVDGMPVSQTEIDELADYFASYVTGDRLELRRRAVAEIMKVKAAQATFKDKVPDLEKRIAEFHQAASAPGADFAQVAREHSECPSAQQGGDLNTFAREQMVAPFARWAFTTPVGMISPVFATHFGYHFLKVTGKENGTTPAESTVRASHVLVMFDKDRAKLEAVVERVTRGSADVAAFDDEWRQTLPVQYR